MFIGFVGPNHSVRARIGPEAVFDLVKLDGYLEGGLAREKLWLARRRGVEANRIEVERMMIELCRLQAAMRHKTSPIIFGRQ
ncbi:hypothetical protein ASF66_13370 [Pseudomonas sp. Leaf129]|nr:hypothetical protein ASF66_13370 [Pseudomonas sp. Leaf129]